MHWIQVEVNGERLRLHVVLHNHALKSILPQPPGARILPDVPLRVALQHAFNDFACGKFSAGESGTPAEVEPPEDDESGCPSISKATLGIRELLVNLH